MATSSTSATAGRGAIKTEGQRKAITLTVTPLSLGQQGRGDRLAAIVGERPAASPTVCGRGGNLTGGGKVPLAKGG